MRVVRVMAPQVMRLDDVPMPVPQAGEALVRITAVGICGSDLQYYTQGRIGELAFGAGHILGHEVAGVVEALGPDTQGPPPGTPVAVDPAIPCGRFCVAGDPNFCERLQFVGSPPRPGALQQYIVHPSRLLLPVPAVWSPAAITVLEPLGVAIHAVDLGHLSVGDAVAVFGCGPIGLMIARVAQRAGARLVCATEPLPHRRAIAARFGVTVALDPAAGDVVREMKTQTTATAWTWHSRPPGANRPRCRPSRRSGPAARWCCSATGNRTRWPFRASRPCGRGSRCASSGA
jgi:L-iditol 2-dehydrogenase